MKKIICSLIIILCLFSHSEAAKININESSVKTTTSQRGTQNDQSDPKCAITFLVIALLYSFSWWLKYQKKKEEQETKQRIKNEAEIALSNNQAQEILKNAKNKADELLTKAETEKNQAKIEIDIYSKTINSMENIIKGYGNEYIISTSTIFDEFAEIYGREQASVAYKYVRSSIREMVKNNKTAQSTYDDPSLKQKAINFLTEIFNLKVDNIIAKAKNENFGILKQKIVDVFNITNYYGLMLSYTCINDDFLHLRIEELRLACILDEIRKRDIEEQKRIKEQMREEEKARREIEKAIKDAAKEEEMLQKAMEKARMQLEKANAEQKTAYENQIAELELKWKEAEERNKRALSMAQQTKSGHVYIISNEGSFGKDVYKIGMTRRLEPLDRIKELSSASVPFSFDVHAMIWSENAPELENMLHKKFALYQVNKVNFKKEFFKISLSEIRSVLEKEQFGIKWTMSAEAREYHESLVIEEKIKDDPQARKDWLNHQLEFENTLQNNEDNDDKED